MGPMTVIILAAIAVCLAVGLGLLIRAARERSQAGRTLVCQRCQTANPEHANFCSQCGASLQ